MARGITISEVATQSRPAVSSVAGLPVYVVACPVNLGDVTKVNVPVLCTTAAEFIDNFGNWTTAGTFANWPGLAVGKAHFSVYRAGPIVVINVMDPDNAAHINSETGETHLLDEDGECLITTYGEDDAQYGVLMSSVVVKKAGVTQTLDTDYSLAFDSDGYLKVTALDDGNLAAGNTITIDFDYLDPSAITANTIIGGYSAGVYSGLSVVDQVYPQLRKVPGAILAPGWSHNATVAASLISQARSIAGGFKALAVCDLSTDPAAIETYADAAAWKSDNGYGEVGVVACWPKTKFGTDVYRTSIIWACVATRTDAAYGGIPYKSPSNESVSASAAVDDDGTEIFLTPPQAADLNAQGIVTLLNTSGGWKLWGNRAAVYPSSTDPKDAWIAIRRMFDYMTQIILVTTAEDVDDPINRRLVDGVLGKLTSWINGMIAIGAMFDGSKIEYRADENPAADLADGRIKWHVTVANPPPANSLEFTAEFDVSLLSL